MVPLWSSPSFPVAWKHCNAQLLVSARHGAPVSSCTHITLSDLLWFWNMCWFVLASHLLLLLCLQTFLAVLIHLLFLANFRMSLSSCVF